MEFEFASDIKQELRALLSSGQSTEPLAEPFRQPAGGADNLVSTRRLMIELRRQHAV